MASASEIYPATRLSLLSRVRTLSDDVAWREFMDIYWDLIYGVARKSGLNHHEAEDLTQEVVLEVARKLKEFRYNRDKGSFRGWLLNLARWRVKDLQRKRNPAAPNSPEPEAGEAAPSLIDLVPSPDSPEWETMFDREYQQNLLALAMSRVRVRVKPTHFQVFDLCEIRHWPRAKVASTLGLNVMNIYLINFRVLAAIKKEVRRLENQTARGLPSANQGDR